jgi:hypothetical protein
LAIYRNFPIENERFKIKSSKIKYPRQVLWGKKYWRRSSFHQPVFFKEEHSDIK